MPPAAGQHNVVAVGAAARGPREGPLAGDDAFEPGLQRHLPRRRVDAAQRIDELPGGAGLGAAPPHRAHDLAERETLGGQVIDLLGAAGLIGGIVGKHLALAGLAEHVAAVVSVTAGGAAAGGLRAEHAAGDGRLAVPDPRARRDVVAVPSHLDHDLLGGFFPRARHVEAAGRDGRDAEGGAQHVVDDVVVRVVELELA